MGVQDPNLRQKFREYTTNFGGQQKERQLAKPLALFLAKKNEITSQQYKMTSQQYKMATHKTSQQYKMTFHMYELTSHMTSQTCLRLSPLSDWASQPRLMPLASRLSQTVPLSPASRLSLLSDCTCATLPPSREDHAPWGGLGVSQAPLTGCVSQVRLRAKCRLDLGLGCRGVCR